MFWCIVILMFVVFDRRYQNRILPFVDASFDRCFDSSVKAAEKSKPNVWQSSFAEFPQNKHDFHS
jgi:hypothetical protein